MYWWVRSSAWIEWHRPKVIVAGSNMQADHLRWKSRRTRQVFKMAMNKKTKKDNKVKEIEESSVLVKPISRFGGLDNIHLAMLILITILIATLLLVSYSSPIAYNQTAKNNTQHCPYYVNSSCITPTHNSSEVLMAASTLLASYTYLNSSLSILPFYTNISKAKVSFIPLQDAWYVSVPSSPPPNNATFYINMVISDKNLSAITPFIEMTRPSTNNRNYVVSDGVIQIYGKSSCASSNKTEMYWFMDPYSPGAISSLNKMIELENYFGSSLNLTPEMMFSPQYSGTVASVHGNNNTRALGSYIYCASKEPQFPNFVSALESAYSGSYLSPNTLYLLARSSGMNMTSLSSCLSSSYSAINAQNYFSNYENIVSSVAVVTDCQYLAIPQTAMQSVCYANSSLCAK